MCYTKGVIQSCLIPRHVPNPAPASMLSPGASLSAARRKVVASHSAGTTRRQALRYPDATVLVAIAWRSNPHRHVLRVPRTSLVPPIAWRLTPCR